jgi:predicted alpha/beta-hydrolase family hydrolase
MNGWHDGRDVNLHCERRVKQRFETHALSPQPTCYRTPANDLRQPAMAEREIKIGVGDGQVSSLLNAPKGVTACYVVAHGAGAGMRHPFMAAVAKGLAERGIATLRYQFPYMERGSKRPDSPKVAHAAVRAAVAEASNLKLPLIAGGKSFGGRMTSQAQAESPLPNVRGLAFLGFPLHPPGAPSHERAEHLSAVKVPMLFVQGTRDEFAELDHLKPVVKHLGRRATLKLFNDANHSFHVPAKSGRKDADVMEDLLDALAQWIGRTIA